MSTCKCNEYRAAAERAMDILMEVLNSHRPDVSVDDARPDSTLPQVRIERYDQNAERTLGRVYLNGKQELFSYELPWLNNRNNVSCIPAGQYTCERHISAKYPDARRAYRVNDVPGRQGILFHSGNSAKDTDGCILLGTKPGRLDVDGKTVDAVLSSAAAMERFHAFLVGRRFELEIVAV